MDDYKCGGNGTTYGVGVWTHLINQEGLMGKILWILAIGVWVLFIGTVVKDYFHTQANKREAFRRDLEYKYKDRRDG